MWRRGAGFLAAVLAAKTSQRRHVLAEAGMPVPAPLHTTAQGFEDAGSSTSTSSLEGGKPVGQPSTQTQQRSSGRNSSSSSSSSSSNSSSKPSKWPHSLLEGTHFAVLTGEGLPARLSSIVTALQHADVALLGEFHDDPVAHALQLELLKRAAQMLGYQPPTSNPAAGARNSTGTLAADRPPQQQQGTAVMPPQRALVLSLEMFERDVQPVLDDYLAGTASLTDLMRDARPWPNYRRDYQPLVDFCKGLATLQNSSSTASTAAAPNAHDSTHSSISASAGLAPSGSRSSSSMVRVVAANAPRRYVSLAGRAGRDALLQLAPGSQAFLAPLPYAQPSQAYVEKVTGSMRQAAADMQQHREQEKLKQQQMNDKQQQRQQQEALTSMPAAAAAAAADGGACPYIGFNVSSNFLDAQCLWDSTMAHSIAQQLRAAHDTDVCDSNDADLMTQATAAADSSGSAVGSTVGILSTMGNTERSSSARRSMKPASSTCQQQQQEGPLVIHVCGKFHAEHRLGIPEHLQLYVPGVRVLVVTFVPADSMLMDQVQFEAAGLKGSADFVVLTNGSLPRSFASVHPV